MFKKGTSGNPAGRPKGIPDKRTEIRDLLKPHAPALVEKAVQLALQGEQTALKLCLDKVIPSLKPVSESVSVNNAGNLSDIGMSVITDVFSGAITTDAGYELLRSLQIQANLEEFTAIEKRLTALERIADK